MSIGRFEVRRVLGRGAQSCVYLAHDPDLQREVAIKRLSKPGNGAPTALPQLEARAVSRLRHPNIVPIFEWGQQDGQAHLVFEYVAGRTLADALEKDGAIPPAKAVTMMIGVLEALEQAHAVGIIHRDLKPSNILIDESGRPRVTDFGLAAENSTAAADAALQGTAAYMAPEYIARGEVTPKYDVFAAGLVLYEVLFGQRAVTGDNAFQAMHQIANMPLVFPEGSTADVDPRLHEIITKATVKDPELRYASAQQMREALQAWTRAPAGATTEGESARQSTLDFLLRRLRFKTDFPAMSSAIQAIQRLTACDKTHVANLSNFILKDFALTNKILRLVNSASYPNRSGDRIRTVSRAIVILGFDTVRSIAISLMLFEHIRDRKHAQALREEYLRANFGALLTRDLGAKLMPTQSEETFICGLFHDLGRLLTHYYLRDEAEAIVRLAQTERCREEAVASRVLGLSYDDLGIGVARSWGFAESIVNAMRGMSDDVPARPTSADEQLRLLCALATEVRGVLETTPDAGRPAAMSVLSRRYAKSLPLLEKDLMEAVQSAVSATADLAGTLGIDWSKSQIGQCAGGAGPSAAPSATTSLTADAGAATIAAAPPAAAVDGEACLAAGIQEVSQALVEELPMQDILRIVTETIYRATGARRAFLCLREAAQPKLRARIAFGPGAEEIAPAFVVDLGGNDLFNRILSKDAGVLIADAGEERVRAHLPAWFARRLDAKTFLVFPLKARGVPIGMFYVDHDRPDGLSVSEGGLAQLHTLRNQALLVLRQKR